jgi:hypothetical protein
VTVGVAIVHYHAEALLRRCLVALCASRHRNLCVTLVDNGSRDGLAFAAALDPRITVVTAPRNLGFAVASNLAVRRLPPGVGTVLLLNPDVILEPDTLDAMLDVLQRDPAVGVVTCRLLRPWGELDPACRRNDPTLASALAKYLHAPALLPSSTVLGAYNLTYLDPGTPHDIGSGTAAFLLLPRRVFEQVGGFDERFFLYGEDLDFCRRIREAGFRIRYDPAATAVHVKGSGRIRRFVTTVHFYRAFWIYYRKWGRFRRNPALLAPLAAALLLLGLRETVANAIRRAFRGPEPDAAASRATEEAAARLSTEVTSRHPAR